ncbi:MAG: hypothetical protein AB1325_13535 [Nitrospirota bacterium]
MNDIKALARSIVRYELFVIHNAPSFILDKETELIVKRSVNVSPLDLQSAIEEVVVDRLQESVSLECLKCIHSVDCFDIEDALISALETKYSVNRDTIRSKLFDSLAHATVSSL